MDSLKNGLRRMPSLFGKDPEEPPDPGSDDEGEPYVISEGLAADRSELGMSAEQQRRWLRRSRNWPDLPTHEWQPKRILGSGSYGVVGHWNYVGKDANMPRDIAVKQTAYSKLDFEKESKFLRKIMGINGGQGSEHIVKMYKGYYTDGGTGTSRVRDPIPFDEEDMYDAELEVARIYLEYCGNGDLENLEKHYVAQNIYVPEEHVWRIFMCIFKGLMVLDRGSEVPGDVSAKQQAWGRPIAHFDIKSANILAGFRTNDPKDDHYRFESFKLADFGLALECPRDEEELLDEKWINTVRWRATAMFMPPEQFFENHENPLIDLRTGVWAAAAVVLGLCSSALPTKIVVDQNEGFPNVAPPPIYSFPYKSLITGRVLSVIADPDKIFDQNLLPYSNRLIDLFCSCLASDPASRPTLDQLVTRCQMILSHYNRTHELDRTQPDPNSLLSPDQSADSSMPEPTDIRNQPAKRPRRAEEPGPSTVALSMDAEPADPMSAEYDKGAEKLKMERGFRSILKTGPMTIAEYPYTRSGERKVTNVPKTSRFRFSRSRVSKPQQQRGSFNPFKMGSLAESFNEGTAGSAGSSGSGSTVRGGGNGNASGSGNGAGRTPFDLSRLAGPVLKPKK